LTKSHFPYEALWHLASQLFLFCVALSFLTHVGVVPDQLHVYLSSDLQAVVHYSTGKQLGMPDPQLHGLHCPVVPSHFPHISGFLQAVVHLSTGKQSGSPYPQSHSLHVEVVGSHLPHLPGFLQAAVHLSTGKQLEIPNEQSHVLHVPVF